jgi:hypothetical protein
MDAAANAISGFNDFDIKTFVCKRYAVNKPQPGT